MARRAPSIVRAEFEPILRDAGVNGWTLKCDGNPGPYQDYVERPTKEEAEELCKGCPIFPNGECREQAVADKRWGVNGGRLYQEGKLVPFAVIVNGVRRIPHEPEEIAA